MKIRAIRSALIHGTSIATMSLLALSSSSLFAGEVCGNSAGGSCFEVHETAACADAACCSTVCALDPFCCETEWDFICRQLAVDQCNPPIPSNDTPAGATFITNAVVPFNTVGATNSIDTEIPVGCAGIFGNQILHDVWFEFRASRTGGAEFSTCPLAGSSARSEIDTIIMVRDAATLDIITCADEGPLCAGYAVANFPTVAGTRYLVQIGGHDLYVGVGVMEVSEWGTPATPSANNLCAAATAIELDTITAFDLLGSTRDNATCADIGVDVWFELAAAPSDGVLALKACSSEGNVSMECVLGDCNGERLCAGDATCVDPGILIDVNEGQTIFVRISGPSVITGTFESTFTVAKNPCPADLNHDSNVNAKDITTLLVNWGTVGADVNGDGLTDAADLTVILSSWGFCP